MNKTEVQQALSELGLQPAKRLGQNFLIDTNMRNFILRTAAPGKDEHILEIGPGLGALSFPLAEAGCRLTAVEIDPRLADFLREKISCFTNTSVVCADACKVDFDNLVGAEDYRCLANLPYSLASPILMHLIKSVHRPHELYILIQEEVADRLTADIGNKSYGALTVQTQMLYDARKLRRLPPPVFYPQPEVNSAFVQLKRHPPAMCPEEHIYTLACRIARKAFSQRRKRALKILKNEYSSQPVEYAFISLGISHDARAENITPSQYVKLSRLLAEQTK